VVLIAFALLLSLATVGALVRGDKVERQGAALFITAWAASLTAQWLSGEASPGVWLPIIDATVLWVLVALTWRSPRPWPVYACGFQMLTLAGDVAKWVKPTLDVTLHLGFLAALSFGAVATLLVGAWFPPRPRQR